MKKSEIISYCHISFINGITDAVSVIMLHKVFVVLMTGNIIFLITDLANGFYFKDFVRLTLIISIVVYEILIHKFINNIDINKRILISILLIVTYVFLGNYYYLKNSIGENSIHFLIVANVATATSLSINNIFYRFHKTKSNLVLYTINLLKLGDMMVERNFKEFFVISSTLFCFILGLVVASFMVFRINFLIFLITIPLLINLYIINLDNTDMNISK